MSHLFYSRIGSYRLLLWWITWPDVLLGCFLVLTWCCFLLTDWILLFYRFAHLSHDWGLPLVFSASVPLASVSSYCRGDPDQFILEMASYSPMTLLLLFFFFLFGQSCLLLFLLFLYFIGILFKISCCYTFYLVTLLQQIVIR